MTPLAKGFLTALSIVLSLLPARLAAQDEGDIRVDHIRPVLRNDTLVVSAEFKNLFSDKIVGTIQSGLPAIVKLGIKLVAAGDKTVAETEVIQTIEYDIWVERYSIHTSDTTRVYSEFDTVKNAIRFLKNEPIVRADELNLSAQFRIQIRIGIVPITTRQADRISDWLLDPNQTEESLASQERASGFKMNLNKLVSFLVGNKGHSRYSSKWYPSRPFTIAELRQ